jgi:hypothetical protein
MSEVGHVRGGRADRSGKEEKQRRPGTNLILLPIGIAYYYKVYLDRGIGLIHLPLRDNNRTVVYDQHLKVQGRIRLMVPRTRLCQQFPCISVRRPPQIIIADYSIIVVQMQEAVIEHSQPPSEVRTLPAFIEWEEQFPGIREL